MKRWPQKVLIRYRTSKSLILSAKTSDDILNVLNEVSTEQANVTPPQIILQKPSNCSSLRESII